MEELHLVILNSMWFGDICSNKTLFCSAMALCALLPSQSKETVSLKTSPKQHGRFRKEISGRWLFPYLRYEHQACLWDLDIFIFNDWWGQEYKPAGGCCDSSSALKASQVTFIPATALELLGFMMALLSFPHALVDPNQKTCSSGVRCNPYLGVVCWQADR